jgi:hypothetical protein
MIPQTALSSTNITGEISKNVASRKTASTQTREYLSLTTDYQSFMMALNISTQTHTLIPANAL